VTGGTAPALRGGCVGQARRWPCTRRLARYDPSNKRGSEARKGLRWGRSRDATTNYSFHDLVSKILFSSDIGANLPPASKLDEPVKRLSEILPYMECFHRRDINANRVCRFWVNMFRGQDVESIVPQHGRAMKGEKVIAEFQAWLNGLECGPDLITQDAYRVPTFSR